MGFIDSAKRALLQKNMGFDSEYEQDLIDFDGNHYTTLGGELDRKFGATVIRADRNWREASDKVKFEPQRINVETMYCTVYNTEKPIQILQEEQYGFHELYDEIPLANVAGVSPYKGGSPHSVAEAIREYGMFPEGTYPYDESITTKDQLKMTPTPAMMNEAAKWKDRWDLGHDWISPNLRGQMQDSLWHALQFSPLGVGVYAWQFDKNSGEYIKPSWATDNHWTSLIVAGEYGKHWIVRDSYLDHTGTPYKKIPWDYDFKFAKRYYLKKKDPEQQEAGYDLFMRLRNKHIIRSKAHGEIYNVTEDAVIYEGWWTNSEWLKKGLNSFLKEQERLGNFIGVSEQDFKDLTSYIKIAGIPLKTAGLAAVNKLNK